MSNMLSGKVKKTPSSQVSASRYSFLSLNEAEPDAGIPVLDNSIFASDTNGIRKWLSLGNGLSVDETGAINVTTSLDGSLVNIDSSELSFSDGANLDEVLEDLDNVLLNVDGLIATFIAEVQTDDTLTGNGLEATPLSVSGILGGINIQKRDASFVQVRLSTFVYNCFKIDPDIFRDSGYAKVYTNAGGDQPVNVLLN